MGPFTLIELFDSASVLGTHGVSAVLNVTVHEPMSRYDLKVVDGLRNSLFGTFGMDLMTNNLVRGREIGLGTYAQLCACYGVEPQNAHVDPLLGMMAEPLEPGSSLPRLVAHICAEQFKRIRVFDPNYWTNQLLGLEPVFRAEVETTSIGKLIRQHVDPDFSFPEDKNLFLL